MEIFSLIGLIFLIVPAAIFTYYILVCLPRDESDEEDV